MTTREMISKAVDAWELRRFGRSTAGGWQVHRNGFCFGQDRKTKKEPKPKKTQEEKNAACRARYYKRKAAIHALPEEEKKEHFRNEYATRKANGGEDYMRSKALSQRKYYAKIKQYKQNQKCTSDPTKTTPSHTPTVHS